MNEFIEKLISRLEEEKEKNPCRSIKCRECPYTANCYEGEENVKVAIDNAIKIINQLAEEYKDNVMINEQYCWQTCGATEHCKECNRLGNGYTDYYENYDFMAEEQNNGWIPCSERLPEEEGYYLITILFYHLNKPVVMGCHFEDGQWWKIDKEDEIIAWMSLPEPYKKEGAK